MAGTWTPLKTFKPSRIYKIITPTRIRTTRSDSSKRGRIIEKVLTGEFDQIETNLRKLIDSGIRDDYLTIWIRDNPQITLDFLRSVWNYCHQQEGGGLGRLIPDGRLLDGTPIEYKTTIHSIDEAKTKYRKQVENYASDSRKKKCLVVFIMVETMSGSQPAIWYYNV